MMQGIPREVLREDGPYQDPTEQHGGQDEELFGAWDKLEPTVASSRRRRGQEEAPYKLRHEGGGEEKDESEDSAPEPYPFGDVPVSSRTRAGLRREAEAPGDSPQEPRVVFRSPTPPGGHVGSAGDSPQPNQTAAGSSGDAPRADAAQDQRPMIEGGPPRLGVVPMLGDSSAEEEAPAGAPSGKPRAGRKLVLKKASVDAVTASKALDSEGIERILNREATLRQCMEEDEAQGDVEQFLGRAFVAEARRLKTYYVDVAAAEMLKAGVGLHLEEDLEGEEWARDDVTGGGPRPCRSAGGTTREDDLHQRSPSVRGG